MNCSNEKQTKAPSSQELGCEYGLGIRTLVYPATFWSQEGKFGIGNEKESGSMRTLIKSPESWE